ncbi:hypothetical protein L9F63_009152, partial [Diploptera punctata]
SSSEIVHTLLRTGPKRSRCELSFTDHSRLHGTIKEVPFYVKIQICKLISVYISEKSISHRRRANSENLIFKDKYYVIKIIPASISKVSPRI